MRDISVTQREAAVVAAGRRKIRPIEIGGFSLHETGVSVHGRPPYDEFQGATDFVLRTHQASGWWLVDLIAYAESRPDWEDKLDEFIDAGVMTRRTSDQYRYIGKHVAQADRRGDVAFGHHAVVAAMQPDEQREWLAKAKDGEWSQSELRKAIRVASRTKIISGQATLDGMYRIIYADPPWRYSDSGPTIDGSLGKAERHYDTMSVADICKLPVQAHATPHATLFLWVTAALLPMAFPVIEAWGFEYKTNWVWDKVLGMPGNYSHVRHEHLLIATRGSGTPDVVVDPIDSVVVVKREGEHSQKPEEFRREIVKRWTTGPYLELFGRHNVKGWSVFGDDARLWANEAKSA